MKKENSDCPIAISVSIRWIFVIGEHDDDDDDDDVIRFTFHIRIDRKYFLDQQKSSRSDS